MFKIFALENILFLIINNFSKNNEIPKSFYKLLKKTFLMVYTICTYMKLPPLNVSFT